MVDVGEAIEVTCHHKVLPVMECVAQELYQQTFASFTGVEQQAVPTGIEEIYVPSLDKVKRNTETSR
jgi:hypothetical protein